MSNSRRLNVLILDGGGIRGLSSLLILQALMLYINQSINALGEDATGQDSAVEPHEVFEFVGGTSTGGLIALMLGKLNMNLNQCIETYRGLSQKIFQKQHIRARITRGLAPARYSGTRLRECVRELLDERGFHKDLPMIRGLADEEDRMACAVVCREHESPSKYSSLKPQPVCICNYSCSNELTSYVCDAARATSAAPTFFPVTCIGGRYFVDGGMEHNNPSFAIFYHYTEDIRRMSMGHSAMSMPSVPTPSSHGDLDFSRARYVNIGTGTKTAGFPGRRRDAAAVKLMPGFVRMGIFLKRTLTDIAVNSENGAHIMKQFERVTNGDVKYERFSADNGVCWIRLDSYARLDEVQRLTLEYLEAQPTRSALSTVASDIARDYLDKHRTNHTGQTIIASSADERTSAPDLLRLATS